ncbi:MAG: hypothetical protein IPK44_25480 [Candidatus Accumulibacter sp.]|uniref:hypothetical protein n=1 Tax=Accumulibacter sp. TaxID=2053492 RepID=UPI00258CB2F1|nr:hypothetical protein [Accumulibacter sp.]MBK8117641.1 hypothetical protein [Accumulibacter sp.]
MTSRRVTFDAAWFDGLLAPNPTRDLPRMDERPCWTARRHGMLPAGGFFVERCRKDYRFHPDKDGELAAAEKPAARTGTWATIWQLTRSPGPVFRQWWICSNGSCRHLHPGSSTVFPAIRKGT